MQESTVKSPDFDAPAETRRVARNGIGFTVEIGGKIDRDFWRKFECGWEPETFALFDALLGPGRRLVDVGGWIGPTALYAAGLGAEVRIYEPDPVALAKLRRNVARNPDHAGRIRIEPAALGSYDGRTELTSKEIGNSMTGMVHANDAHRVESIEAPVVDAAGPAAAPALACADLVKIDIEGGEFEVVPRLRRLIRTARPRLYLSLHGFFLRADLDRRARQRWLVEAIAGYPFVYRAKGAVWRRLHAPDATLRKLAADAVLDGSLLLSRDAVPRLA